MGNEPKHFKSYRLQMAARKYNPQFHEEPQLHVQKSAINSFIQTNDATSGIRDLGLNVCKQTPHTRPKTENLPLIRIYSLIHGHLK